MKTSPDAQPEFDLWWGSYSGWSMLPSFLVCAVLTILVIVVVREWQTREWAQWTVFGVVVILWTTQLLRWSYRIFTKNYRFTTRRLYIDEGCWLICKRVIELRTIRDVQLDQKGIQAWLKIGTLRIWCEGMKKPALLESVLEPARVAERIRQQVAKSVSTD